MPKRRHIVGNGEQFSRLTVRETVKRPVMTTFCECVCECGVIIYVRPRDLKLGIVRSCGCLNKDTQRKRLTEMNRKHGCAPRGAQTSEYRVWAAMKSRCLNPNSTEYAFYGGRGIKVCRRWMTFENFIADMGQKPSPKHSIDRLNSNGNYKPGNCKWSTHAEQDRNRRSNRNFTVNGMTFCMTDWAKRLEIPYKTLWMKIERGQTMKEIVEAKELVGA